MSVEKLNIRLMGLRGLMRPIGLGLVGLCLMGVVACSSSESFEEPAEPEMLGFSASIVANTTRAAGAGELTTELLKDRGFGVYCWYTGSTSVLFTDAKETTPADHISAYATYMLMRNQKVTWDDDADLWTYTPIKYWPQDPSEKLTFRAYAPYTDYLVTDDNGMPQLPVVLDEQDYHNNTQHDPLWGTSRHEGSDDDETRYGILVNNYTYANSGTSLTDDNRDGTIDWYFHHGMAKIIFWGLLDDEGTDEEVTILNIRITPLYNHGLLDISSPVEGASDNPFWTQSGGDMTVDIDGEDLGANVVQKYDEDKPNNGWTQLTADDRGLLIIPRDYSGEPMTLTVTIQAEGSDPRDITATIDQVFVGNTIYTFKMTLGNTVSVEIQSVKAAVTPWTLLAGDHEVYNW